MGDQNDLRTPTWDTVGYGRSVLKFQNRLNNEEKNLTQPVLVDVLLTDFRQ
ncbi:MAG: hypothetical protein KJP23_20260 [Deltaproteobacteria bacterium]|nr:hypothetical protein [Deltaproteobacteria bacterium]